jgi:hypothetical protein
MPEKPKQGDPNWYGEQDENGVDLSLIRQMLKLTPLERARRADRARRDTLRLREHAQRAWQKRI